MMNTTGPKPPIAIVGAGRLGTVLAIALQRAGYPIAACASRSEESARRLADRLSGCEAVANPGEAAHKAEVVFLTVPDDAIEAVAGEISWEPRHLAVHCSGAEPVTTLRAALAAGARAGGFHPLQSFADPDLGLESLPGSAMGIDADDATWPLLEAMARDIGAAPLRLGGGDRALYHAASVFVSNGTVGLVAIAADLWRTLGIDQAEAVGALLPLLRGTLRNIDALGIGSALTGPVARGDVGTVERHLGALRSVPQALATYRALSTCLIELARERGTITPDQAAALHEALMQSSVQAQPERNPT